jgi:hypothetical protein
MSSNAANSGAFSLKHSVRPLWLEQTNAGKRYEMLQERPAIKPSHLIALCMTASISLTKPLMAPVHRISSPSRLPISLRLIFELEKSRWKQLADGVTL